MPYPTTATPSGLIPVNLIGGQVFASATRQIPLATNSSTAIFFGDVVKLTSAGVLEKDVVDVFEGSFEHGVFPYLSGGLYRWQGRG